jgi:hypothetical protein
MFWQIVKFSTDTNELINEEPHFPKFVTVLISVSKCMKKTGHILSCYCKVVYFSVSTNVTCHLYYYIYKSALLLYRHIRMIWESTVSTNCVSKMLATMWPQLCCEFPFTLLFSLSDRQYSLSLLSMLISITLQNQLLYTILHSSKSFQYKLQNIVLYSVGSIKYICASVWTFTKRMTRNVLRNENHYTFLNYHTHTKMRWNF